MVAVVLQFLGQIQECFTLGIDGQLAINDPASVRGVLNCVPQVAVAGDDAVALSLQLSGCVIELVPVAGAGAELLSDNSGIVGAPDVLGDGAAVDEGAAGCLVAQSNDLAVIGTGADIHRVLCDFSSLDISIDVDAQVCVGSCVLGGVTLSVLQDECSLGAVQVGSVSAACCQSLVQSGLIQAVSSSNDGDLDFVLLSEIRVQFQVLVDHLGNFIGEGPDVQDSLSGVSCGSIGCGSICGRCICGRCAATATCNQTQNHYQSQ